MVMVLWTLLCPFQEMYRFRPFPYAQVMVSIATYVLNNWTVCRISQRVFKSCICIAAHFFVSSGFFLAHCFFLFAAKCAINECSQSCMETVLRQILFWINISMRMGLNTPWFLFSVIFSTIFSLPTVKFCLFWRYH